MINNRYIIIFLILTLSASLKAQDVYFSQYYNSPLNASPSNTGDFDGSWRISTNFRNQWNAFPEPFTTSGLSFEMPITLWDKKVGIGISYLHDESGSLLLTADQLYLSAAIEHITNNDHILRGGLQIGFSYKSIDSRKITTPNQFDNTIGDFNQNLWNHETDLKNSSSYLDINIGGSWSKIYVWGKPSLGLSFFHVNFPKETFLNQNEHLYVRTNITGKLVKKLNTKITLLPRVLISIHKRSTTLNLGSEFFYSLNDKSPINKSVFIGAFVRNSFSANTDAVIFGAGMIFDNIKFGVSYDVNISNLKSTTNYNGALEFAFIYTLGYDKYKNFTIPCQRY